MPVIGFLDSGSPAPFAGRLAKFQAGLATRGYVEGQNVIIEYRWAEGHYDRLSSFAKDLVEKGVAVIAATGSPNAARAALAATRTIPIVFANGGDPVRLGLVPNLNRPPANATGVSFFNSALVGKRLEIARELVPATSLVGFIVNPDNPNTVGDINDAQAAARVLSLQIVVSPAASEEQFEAAFSRVIKAGAKVVIVNNDAFFSSRYDDFVALAVRHQLPAVYYLRSFVAAGGLASYGTDIEEMYRAAGIYVARVLQGATPSELPVMLPTRFQFARADEVIE
jgi:putative ABC transport system substrate-binding protein